MSEIKFKSYCWCVGTTSYRTKNYGLSIELQLDLLDRFLQLESSQNQDWRELQAAYYYYLKKNGFVQGDALRPDKDAREKTSGMVDIGLLTQQRKLTEAGEALLLMSRNKDFNDGNEMQIQADSYLYFKQLLKTSITVEGKIIRPFIVFLYLSSKLDGLSIEEFAYFMPMCVDNITTQRIIEEIKLFRLGKVDLDDAIFSVVEKMDNYVSAFDLLSKSTVVDADLICTIGFNRKSKSVAKYDTIFLDIYNALNNIYIKEDNDVSELYEAICKIKGNTKVLWKKKFFGKNIKSLILEQGKSIMQHTEFDSAKTVQDIKRLFFKTLHTFKVKATLADYKDLNRRYFMLSDCILFKDGRVEIDVLPKAYIKPIIDGLYNQAYIKFDLKGQDLPLYEIDNNFKTSLSGLYKELSNSLGVTVSNAEEAKNIVRDVRYSRFNQMLDEKYSKSQLVNLLSMFEDRSDDELNKYITDAALVPTLYEYIVGIAWYQISERQGDILEYINLSLDANLLPKSHAGGLMADIVYQYEANQYYPKHSLLIEATLSEKGGQRIMEMEPVSRHLGEYSIANKGSECYCVFAPTNLNPNIVCDFRMRKNASYVKFDGTDSIRGLKIIPFASSELKTALINDISYKSLYEIFADAHNSEAEDIDWYAAEIVDRLNLCVQ